MRSALRLTMLLLASLPLTACAGSTLVVTPGAGCSGLIPAGWTEPVPPPAFPADLTSARDWQVYGVETTGQLTIANGRTSDVISIVKACEARDQEAIRKTRPWWRRMAG